MNINLIFCFIILVITIRLIFAQKYRVLVIEGILIGLVSGIFTSYTTSDDYRASINGPVIQIVKTINNSIKYKSGAWTNIEVTHYDPKTDIISIDATKIDTGITVRIENQPLSKLPADLRYDVATGDSLYYILNPSRTIP